MTGALKCKDGIVIAVEKKTFKKL
jgi:20S proteasome subunit alpha 4